MGQGPLVMHDRAQASSDLTNAKGSLDRSRRKVSASIGGRQRYRVFHLHPARPRASGDQQARIADQRALIRRSGRIRQPCLADKSRMNIRRREAYEHPVMPQVVRLVRG